MDVRTKNRGHVHQKCSLRFRCWGETFWPLAIWASGSGMSAGNSDQKIFMFMLFFFPDRCSSLVTCFQHDVLGEAQGWSESFRLWRCLGAGNTISESLSVDFSANLSLSMSLPAICHLGGSGPIASSNRMTFFMYRIPIALEPPKSPIAPLFCLMPTGRYRRSSCPQNGIAL